MRSCSRAVGPAGIAGMWVSSTQVFIKTGGIIGLPLFESRNTRKDWGKRPGPGTPCFGFCEHESCLRQF
jgi:hypothetical protein